MYLLCTPSPTIYHRSMNICQSDCTIVRLLEWKHILSNNNVENRTANDCMVFRARKREKYLKMTFTDWMMQIKKKKNAKKIIIIRTKICRYRALCISNISYSSVVSSISAKLLPYDEHHHISFIINVCLLCFWTLNIICLRYMCAFGDKCSFISINIFSLSGSAFAMLSSLVEWRKKYY